MSHVFINYRRDDSSLYASLLFLSLTRDLGETNVFYDVDGIPYGSDWRKILDEQIRSSQVLLALIGEKWLRASDENGRRRLDDPNDWVRFELEAADRHGLTIIPILLGNSTMPDEEALPETLRYLPHLNAARVRNEPDFRHDSERLIRAIKAAIEGRARTAEAERSAEDGAKSPAAGNPRGVSNEPPVGAAISGAALDRSAAGLNAKASAGSAGAAAADPAPAQSVAPAASPQESGAGQPGVVTARWQGFKPGDRPIAGNDLELVALLGRGGFGEVWKAANPLFPKEPVALKFCLDLEAQQLLRHEAKTVARVMEHGRNFDGIVPLLRTYFNADPPALEFKYISDGTLAEHIKAAAPGIGTIPVMLAQRIVRRLAEIVAFFHRADPPIVHRDLKPANVLIEMRAGKTNLRISDFGIGGVAASRVIIQAATTGKSDHIAAMLKGAHTPLYASPQQISGKQPDPRDDVHALGVIWYQLLTGDTTIGAPSGSKWVEALKDRGVRPEAIELLNCCIEQSAADRPADAGVLRDCLVALEKPKAVSVAGGPSTMDLPSGDPDADPSGGLPVLPVAAAGKSSKSSARPRLPNSTRRSTDSGRGEDDSVTYPRLAADGTTQLLCECGKIVTIPAAISGGTFPCPSCNEKITVPGNYVTPPADPGERAKPSRKTSVSDPPPLRWSKVLVPEVQPIFDEEVGGRNRRKWRWPSVSAAFGAASARPVAVIVCIVLAIILICVAIAASGSSGSRMDWFNR